MGNAVETEDKPRVFKKSIVMSIRVTDEMWEAILARAKKHECKPGALLFWYVKREIQMDKLP